MKFDKTSNKLKPFLITFVIFILILTCFSAFMFMDSIDYDFDNIFEGKTTVKSDDNEKVVVEKYSVSTLKGKSNLLFVVLGDETSVDFAFMICTDFDKKSMQVEVIDDSTTLSTLYNENAEKGIKNYISGTYGIDIEKYAVFTRQQFKNSLSNFNGFSLNVVETINYKSQDFNLFLNAGNQVVSGEIIYKYLMIVDTAIKEKVICDIINSVLTNEYLNNSESLFKKFVNSCVTDISIVNYSDSMEVLNVYVNAEDKFLPEPYVIEE